ncbi:MAG: lactoylglutathione lyase [Myxococcota bacterium]
MSRHFEEAPGLCEAPDSATDRFVLNHCMLRVKAPGRSLDFYSRVFGMQLIRKLDFGSMRFTLYFLGRVPEGQSFDTESERTAWVFAQPGLLELTHNWGTEDDPDQAYHDGNAEPQGFGHIAFSVPDVDEACARFDALGVPFVKRPDEGRMKGVAFVKDPDGYWIEIVQPERIQSLVEAL